MASSSSSRYDVFVSFGPDVRLGFLSHLIKAFRQKDIDAYADDSLGKGDGVSSELLKAMEVSEISMIIFSPDYASSEWCLNELVKVFECMEKNSQIVIPVFYQIDPGDILLRRGKYEFVFAEHEKRYDSVKVKNWRAVLSKAANLSGFSLSDTKSEAEFVEEIAKFVAKKLDDGKFDKYYKNFVGLDRRIAEVELILDQGSEKASIVGICGARGIGKTTIAYALFNKLFSKCKGSYAMVNLREELENNLREELENNWREGSGGNIASIKGKEPAGNMEFIKGKLYPDLLRDKVGAKLIILDDIYESEDLESLIHVLRVRDWSGRIIIVTGKNKQVLRSVVGDNHIYEVEALKDDEALQLLSLNAFKQKSPKEEWVELSMRAVKYAKGNPLVLTILGSSLFGLNRNEWEGSLESCAKMCPEDYINYHLNLKKKF